MSGGLQVLAAVLDPLQGCAGHGARHHAQGDVLGIQHGFGAEPTAHVGGDDADVAFGHAEQLGDHVADQVRHLRAGPERELLPRAVPQRDPGTALHRVPGVAVGGEFALDDDG